MAHRPFTMRTRKSFFTFSPYYLLTQAYLDTKVYLQRLFDLEHYEDKKSIEKN